MLTGAADLVDAVFKHGLIAVTIAVAVIAFAARFATRSGRILADDYTGSIAESLLHLIANTLVMTTAFVVSWRAPRLAETVDEQLQILEGCQRDGDATGLDLLRHALSFPLKLWSTARSKEKAARRHVDLALPPDDEGKSVIIRAPVVEAKADIGLPTIVGEAHGRVDVRGEAMGRAKPNRRGRNR